jgi:hypothetical protein
VRSAVDRPIVHEYQSSIGRGAYIQFKEIGASAISVANNNARSKFAGVGICSRTGPRQVVLLTPLAFHGTGGGRQLSETSR